MKLDLGPDPTSPGYDRALDLDRNDRLGEMRDLFVDVDPTLIYLDGNSLGRAPMAAVEIVNDVASRQWGDRMVRSWNESWWDLQTSIGDLLAPLVGASPGEIIISDSTSVNLYKLGMAAVMSRPGRGKIVTDDLNFPSDVYVLEGIARATGRELVIVQSDGVYGPQKALREVTDSDTALVSLSHTAFKSGFTYDMTSLTHYTHEAGALTLWDCSHSLGAVPIDLTAANADLAVGCTYKYLSGGPGSPAFLYVRTDLQDVLENPIMAWWGHAAPFEFDLHFRPISGIRRFHTGTMPILSLATVEAGIACVAKAGMAAIRAKSVDLGEFLISEWVEHLKPLGFDLASPTDPAVRGSHVSMAHSEAWPLTRALIDIGNVIPDYRMPDNIRFGLSPLSNSFLEVHCAVQRLKRIVISGLYKDYVGPIFSVT